jgi:hypothetical protein
MKTPDEPLTRIADALEQIAASLQYFEHLAAAAQPAPRLKVSRGPGDRSGRTPVTLTTDGRLTVIIYNEGAVAAEISEPQARFGAATESGGVIGLDGRPHDRGEVGPTGVTTLTFDLDRSALELYADSPLELNIPFSPGRFPIGNCLAVQLEPLGAKDGRYGWTPVSSRELSNRAEA